MGCGGSRAVAAVQPIDEAGGQVITATQETDNGIKNGLGMMPNTAQDARAPNGHPIDQPDLSSTPLNPGSPLQPLPVKQGNGTSAVAFEIPLDTAESLIQRHPPKRFTRLEDNQLTLDIFKGKHADATDRRNKILNQRVQSARTRNLRSAGRAKSRTTTHSDDDPIESGVDEERKDGTELS